MEKIELGDLSAFIRKGAKIGIGNACGEPQTIVDVLFEKRGLLDSIEIYGMILYQSQRLVNCYPESRFKLKTFMVDRYTVDGIKKGYVEYIPCRYSKIPSLFHNGHISLDVALISVSPPNSGSNCSLGVSSDFTLAMAKNAKIVIAEVNQQMPWVYGKSFLHSSEIDFFLESDRSLPQVIPIGLRDAERKVGEYVAEIVDDGATIQIGIGRLSEGILSCLYDKRHLGFHSGLISDGLVELVERGVVDNSCKGLKNGKVVTTTMVGTDKLFHFVNKNRSVESYPSDYTHNQVTLAKINRLHAINSAVQVDLLGQINAETIHGIQISGVGGQADFVCGAALSKGGKSIIVTHAASENEEESRIVPYMDKSASITSLRHDVDYVVTEYGIAHLTGKTQKERAEALIEISHPNFKDWLKRERQRLFL